MPQGIIKLRRERGVWDGGVVVLKKEGKGGIEEGGRGKGDKEGANSGKR